MKGKEALFIVISSFFLTVIWIASNVYHSYATSTIDPLLRVQIEPIAPDFDQSTIEAVKKREKIAPETSTIILTTPAPTEAEPTPTVTIQAEPTISQAEPSPTLTESTLTPTPGT